MSRTRKERGYGDEEGWGKQRERRDVLRKGRAGYKEDEVGGKERGYTIAGHGRRKRRKKKNEGGVQNKRRNILGG